MELYLQAIVTIVSLINPTICGAILISMALGLQIGLKGLAAFINLTIN